MDAVTALFNVVVIVFIVSMMFAAGLGTTMGMLTAALRNVPLLALVLAANLVAIPLLGWGLGSLLALDAGAFVGLVLLASSPGGPFGAKLAMIQKGEVVTAAAMQVVLAAIGSLTFGLTAGWILGATDFGGDIQLDVADLVRTVALLQLVPFAVGLGLRQWVPDTAADWLGSAIRVSNVTFPIVLVGMLLGSWSEIVALLGSLTIVAGVLFAAGAFGLGTLLASGPMERRTALGSVASVRNFGPVLAAIGIAFSGDPQVLGPVAAILVCGMVVSLPLAAWLARGRSPATQP